MNQQLDEPGQVSAGLRKMLNIHGYGFHYAIMRKAEQLFSSREAGWVLEGSEFPVATRYDTTHIDFILRRRSSRTYLVAECKRADPARARWCFAKAPYTWRNARTDEIILDEFKCGPANTVLQKPCIRRTTRGTYHVGLELRTGEPGDGIQQGGLAINQAVSQVLRGTSGLINHLLLVSRGSFNTEETVTFIPVIFTTAQIWVTGADLGAATLENGHLPGECVEAARFDWIWFSHNRSPHLRHDLEWTGTEADLAKEMRYEFARSIAIVSPQGVEAFFNMDVEELLED